MFTIGSGEFWVAIAFLIAVVLVWRKALTVVGGLLDERAQRIKGELDEAERLREDAERALAEYQRKQRDALSEAEGIIAQTRAEAERYGERAARELKETLERRTRQAEEKIAQEEAKALGEVRSVAIDLAIGAARRIIAERLDAKAGGDLIDDAIAALPAQLH